MLLLWMQAQLLCSHDLAVEDLQMVSIDLLTNL